MWVSLYRSYLAQILKHASQKGHNDLTTEFCLDAIKLQLQFRTQNCKWFQRVHVSFKQLLTTLFYQLSNTTRTSPSWMVRAARPSWSLKRWKITGTVYLPNMAVINGPNGFQQHPTDQLHTAVWKHITTCSMHTVVKNEVVKSENTTPQQCSSRSFEKTHGNFLACASFTIHPALHIQCYLCRF